jgi:hypothetical protein
VEQKTSNLWAINLLGYLFLACGIGGTIADFVSRWRFSFPLNMGIIAGNVAMIAAGLFGTMVVASLKDVDARLKQIERALESTMH